MCLVRCTVFLDQVIKEFCSPSSIHIEKNTVSYRSGEKLSSLSALLETYQKLNTDAKQMIENKSSGGSKDSLIVLNTWRHALSQHDVTSIDGVARVINSLDVKKEASVRDYLNDPANQSKIKSVAQGNSKEHLIVGQSKEDGLLTNQSIMHSNELKASR